MSIRVPMRLLFCLVSLGVVGCQALPLLPTDRSEAGVATTIMARAAALTAWPVAGDSAIVPDDGRPPPHDWWTGAAGDTVTNTSTPTDAARSPEAAACGLAPMLPVKVCEAGGGFVCLDTPAGGVVGDAVVIQGLVDRVNQVFAGMKIFAQHEATRNFLEIPTQNGLMNDCAKAALSPTQPFCLDAAGRFSARIPLIQLGAYRVSVQAFRANGEPAIDTAAVSRVIAPTLQGAAVTIDPDPTKNNGVVSTDQVLLNLDLLPTCEQCDFIGSTTGATVVTVVNTIVPPGIASQRVVRTTNQGSDGRYSFCVPVGAGENRLDIITCNAATGLHITKCPHTTLPPFQGGVPPIDLRLQWPSDVANPPPGGHPGGEVPRVPVFDARQYPTTIPITFTLSDLPAGVTTAACAQSPVTLEWNRDPPIPVCPVNGVYHAAVTPQAGVNLGVVHIQQAKEGVDYPFTVGWGALRSPWSGPGQLRPTDDQWLSDALVLGIRQAFLTETIRVVLNHVAASDQLEALIQRAVEQPAPKATSAATITTEASPSVAAKEIEAIRATIPHCEASTKSDDPFSQWRTRLVQPPQIGAFEVAKVEFVPDAVKLTIDLQNVSFSVQLFRDDNYDGVPDFKVLPLQITFRHLVLFPEIRLVRGAAPQMLLTAPDTDCAFKSGTYCTHQPALIVPRNFAGGVDSYGGFVLCDAGQAVDDVIAKGCEALNSLNDSTALFNERVLDALNAKAYCDGSAYLTHMLRDGFRNLDLRIGCREGVTPGPFDLFPCGDANTPAVLQDRYWELPLGLDFIRNLMTISEKGITARVATRVGSADFFRRLPADVQLPTTGYLVHAEPPRLPFNQGVSGSRDLTFGVAEGFFNQLHFLLAMQGDAKSGNGIFDWDLHEPFFKQIGFDFVQECNALPPGKKEPTLCSLRPRVADMLGAALTTAGYFPPRQPLMLRLRGSRWLAPHVAFYRANVPVEGSEEGGVAATRNAQLLDVQIPDLEVSFYALQTDPNGVIDQYGNLPLKLDAKGQPFIQSLRPEDPVPANGPIVRFKATLLLTLELGALETDASDPTHWVLPIKTNVALTRLGFQVPPGGNATIVNDASLLSAFREQILYGVKLFASDQDAIRLRLPKQASFPTTVVNNNSLMTLLGLAEMRVGKEGLQLGIDEGEDYFTIGGNLFFIQRLLVNGRLQEWEVP